jgi:hypothetical protein
MAGPTSVRLVHPFTLLRMFKEVGYEAAILEKRATPGKPNKDVPGPSHQPPGTRSQSVPYFLAGHRIAICHQYTLPDGSFGASGKPDPKMVEYRAHRMYCHSQPCKCPVCTGKPENWRGLIAL